MRVPQAEGTKGSLKWIQRAVALRPDLLQPPGLAPIRWLSPLASDDFAEYRDGAFLDLLGLGHLTPALAAFWPRGGPQWDALGLAGDLPVLLEAKAHIGEFLSPPTQARDAARAQINAAFAQVQPIFRAKPRAPWTDLFYQYANRLAHLAFLHAQGCPAHLMFVGFLGDQTPGIDGPATAEAWQAAFHCADHVLGLPRRHPLARYIHHLTPHVRDLI
ncbi:MAG: hypothetical protein IE922_02185 [Sphingomonadales bacterium]|nr:hypothetical protein [Sphingomonadales bacterium]